MKYTSTKEQLIELITYVEKLASRSAALPILQCVLLSVHNKQLTVRATNLEVGVELTMPVKVDEEGSMAVQAGVLGNLLSSLPHGASITISKKEGVCVVTTTHVTAKLPTLPVEDFPTLPTISPDTTISLSSSALASALKLVLPSVSTSTFKPELSSVFLQAEGTTLTVVATDSFRLVEKKVVYPISKSTPPILIPQRSIPDLIRVLEYCGKEEVLLSITTHQATIEKPGVFATFRLTDGTFPNYTAILPTTFVSEVKIVRHDFLQALRSASVFTNTVNQGRLTLSPTHNTLTLDAGSNDAGETTLSIEGVVSGKELVANFNLRYLTEALNLFATDSVQLSCTGADSPAILRGVGDTSTLALVMPNR